MCDLKLSSITSFYVIYIIRWLLDTSEVSCYHVHLVVGCGCAIYSVHSKSTSNILQLRFTPNGLLHLSKFVASRLYYLVRSQNMPNTVCPRVKGTRQFFSLYHILWRSRSTATSTCGFCRKMH